MKNKKCAMLISFVMLVCSIVSPLGVYAQGDSDKIYAFAEILDEQGEVIQQVEFETTGDEEVFFYLISDPDGATESVAIGSDSQPVIVPRWKYVAVIGMSLSFEGNTAKMIVTVSAYPTVSKVSLSPSLYRINSSSSSTWLMSGSKTANGIATSWSGSKAVTKGYSYELRNTTKAYTSGSSTPKESINTYIQKKCG